MVTYLVVLLQFQISIPDNTQDTYEDEKLITNDTIATDATKITTTLATTILTTLAKKKKKN